ncbi:hypothetical protein [Deinococcus pimensis]|uniref:hypothetical protein n=1 Tax=Deinococcus pimensis TaxID=309888 RepID=UPI0004B1EB21|nr:hypothetical protein [Deinococcus pimensis]
MREDRSSKVFGTVFLEIVMPPEVTSTPRVDGWTLRVWPVARLGDGTLEAEPDLPGACLTFLIGRLRAAGITPLVPPSDGAISRPST